MLTPLQERRGKVTMSRWQVLVISPDVSEHLRPHGTKVLGEPRRKESSQQTRLAVGVAQDTGRVT